MFGEIWSLEEKDDRKLSTFENGCLGVSCMNHIKMGNIKTKLEISNKMTDIIKKKRLK